MPRVGSRHFSYGPKGRSAAARYAKKTGKKIGKKTVARKKATTRRRKR